MTITVAEVKNAGDVQHERLVLRVEEDVDVGKYILLCTAHDGKSALSGASRSFWFRDFDAKKGDIVVVYTKDGLRKDKPNSSGHVSYFEYWGSPAAIWGENAAAVLLKIDEFSTRIMRDAIIGDDSELD